MYGRRSERGSHSKSDVASSRVFVYCDLSLTEMQRR
jgi:hypothetical protein